MSGANRSATTDRVMDPDPRQWQVRRSVAVLAAALLVFFANLGGSRLWDRDEPRNAQAAREMQQRGDWIVPSFNDQLRHQKPILPYWLIRLSYLAWGDHEFSARFPSAALATVTVCLLGWCTSRALGSGVGFLAALMLTTALMFDVAARATTPDAVLIACFSASVFWYADRVITRCEGSTPSAWFVYRWESAVYYVLIGLGALAKGLAGVIVPMAVVGMWMLIQRLPPDDLALRTGRLGWIRYGRWLSPFAPLHFLRTVAAMQPVWAVVWIGLVAAPWFIAVGFQTDGEFLRRFFVDEHWGRATTTFESHRGGWWYYPVTLLVGFFPWSMFAVPVVLELRATSQAPVVSAVTRGWLRLAVCWVAVQVGIFSIAQTKLPSYVTPCYPALAILTAWAGQRYLRRVNLIPDHWFRAGHYVWAVVGLASVVGLGWIGHTYVAGQWSLGAVGLPLFVSGVWASAFSGGDWTRRYGQWCGLTLGAIVFAVLLHGWGAARVSATSQMERILMPLRQAEADVGVATFRCLESSWVYYGRYPIHELEWGAGPVKSPMKAGTNERDWRVSLWCDPMEFAQHFQNAYIIVPQEHVAELVSRLPGVWKPVADAPYFLKEQTLVLLQGETKQ